MNFADKVTLLRVILIPFFLFFLLYSRKNSLFSYISLVIFALAVLSDFLDGLVARIKKEKSPIGTIIDPLADKLLLLTAFISLYLLKFNLPLWVVITVVSRDAIILLGALILHLFKMAVPIVPSVWGKLTTFFQMLTIFVALLNRKFGFEPVLWTITVTFTIISGIGYFVRGIRAINGNVYSNI